MFYLLRYYFFCNVSFQNLRLFQSVNFWNIEMTHSCCAVAFLAIAKAKAFIAAIERGWIIDAIHVIILVLQTSFFHIA